MAVVVRRGRPAGEVPTPVTCRVRVGRVEVLCQHDEEDNGEHQCDNAESPGDHLVSLGLADDRVEEHANQEAHEEAANVGKVVEVWSGVRTRTGERMNLLTRNVANSEADDELNDHEDELPHWLVLILPVCEEVHPSHCHCSEDGA